MDSIDTFDNLTNHEGNRMGDNGSVCRKVAIWGKLIGYQAG